MRPVTVLRTLQPVSAQGRAQSSTPVIVPGRPWRRRHVGTRRDPRGSSADSPVPTTEVDDAGRGRPCTTLGTDTFSAPHGSTGRTQSPTPLDNASRRPVAPLPTGSSDALTTSTTAATTTHACHKAANTYYLDHVLTRSTVGHAHAEALRLDSGPSVAPVASRSNRPRTYVAREQSRFDLTAAPVGGCALSAPTSKATRSSTLEARLAETGRVRGRGVKLKRDCSRDT